MKRSIRGARVLVTGGAGFIGSHLVDALIEAEARQVVIVDNLFCGREENIRAAVEKGSLFYKEDMSASRSVQYIFERHSIDIVFNCATKALNYSFINPADAFETSTGVVLNLLELQRKGRFQTLCQFSTSEVFGSAAAEEMDEAHARNPTTTYAAGKAAADLAVESYVRMFSADSFILRPFNNYGPRQNWEGELAALIPATIRRIIQGKQPVMQGSGDQSRDFIHVEDTVRAVLKLTSVTAPGDSVNVSGETQITVKDVIRKVCDAMDYHGEIDRVAARPSDVFRHRSNVAKMKSLIDLEPVPFDKGLKETVSWYRKRLRSTP